MPWVVDETRCPWASSLIEPVVGDMTSLGLFIRASDGFIQGHTYLVLARTDGGVFARDLTADFGAPNHDLSEYTPGQNAGMRFRQRSTRWPNFPHVRFVDGDNTKFVIVWVKPTDIIVGEFETFFPTFGIDRVTVTVFSYGGQQGAETVTIPYGESPVLPKLAMTQLSQQTVDTNEVILRTLNLNVFENIIQRVETWTADAGGDCVIDSLSPPADGLVVQDIKTLTPSQIQYGISNPLSIYPRLNAQGNVEVLALYTGLFGCELPMQDDTLGGFSTNHPTAPSTVSEWVMEFQPFNPNPVLEAARLDDNYTTYRNQWNFLSNIVGQIFRFPYYYVVNLTTKQVLMRTIAAATTVEWEVYYGNLNRVVNIINLPVEEPVCPGGITPSLNFTTSIVSETNWTTGIGTLGVPWFGFIMDTLPTNPYLAEPWKTEWVNTTVLMHRERIAQTVETVFSKTSSVYRYILMVAPQALVTPDAGSLLFQDIAGGGSWPESGVYVYRVTWDPTQAGLAVSPGWEHLFRVDAVTKSVGILALIVSAGLGNFSVYRKKHPNGAWARVFGPSSAFNFTDTGAAGTPESPSGGAAGGHTGQWTMRDQQFFHDTPQHPQLDGSGFPEFAAIIQRSGEFPRLANILAGGSLEESGDVENLPVTKAFTSLGSRWALVRERAFPDAVAFLDRQNLARYAIDQTSLDTIHVGPDPLMDLDFLMSRLRFQYAGGDAMGVTLGQGVDQTLKKALKLLASGPGVGTLQLVSDVNTPTDVKYPRVGKTPDSNNIHVQYQDGKISVPAVETQNMPS